MYLQKLMLSNILILNSKPDRFGFELKNIVIKKNCLGYIRDWYFSKMFYKILKFG